MIDAHHHLWKYSASEYGWISPQMPALRRDFLPEDLEKVMHHFGIEGTVAVQARQSLEETEWLLDLAGRLSSSLEPLRWFSAFRYYGAPLRDGIDVSNFVVLTAAGIVLIAAGAVLFDRRDLGH